MNPDEMKSDLLCCIDEALSKTETDWKAKKISGVRAQHLAYAAHTATESWYGGKHADMQKAVERMEAEEKAHG